MYGVDAADNLIQKVISQSSIVKPDVIIVNGDIVAHGHAAESTDNSSVIETKWNSSKDIMNIVFFMMRSQYPD
jgi:hypothetical protein